MSTPGSKCERANPSIRSVRATRPLRRAARRPGTAGFDGLLPDRGPALLPSHHQADIDRHRTLSAFGLHRRGPRMTEIHIRIRAALR
jgi:hypothetical protein